MYKKGQAITMYKVMTWIPKIFVIGILMMIFMYAGNKYIDDLRIIPDKLDETA